MKTKLLTLLIFLIWHGGLWAAEDKSSSPSLDLEKIIVTPSKFEQYYKYSSADIDVVEGGYLEASGATEITQVLDTLPTVDVVSYGYLGSTKTVHIRGASNSQVVTLIDGRPISTPRDGVADYNQIPLNNIERVEVLKGPASSVYGANAVGGVVNIITKSGKEKMFTELNLKSGSFYTSGMDFANGWKKGNIDYFISTNLIQSNGSRVNSDYKQQNYNLKLGDDINKDNRLTFESGYTTSKVGTPGQNASENQHLNDRQEQRKDYFDLTWDGTCWEDSKVLAKVYKNLDRIEFIEPLASLSQKFAHQTEVYGADLQLSQIWFEIFRTSIGVDGQENFLNSSTSGKHDYNYKAAYAETQLDLFKSLTLKGGARIDDYSNFGNKTSPSASFCWWLFDAVKLHGLAARSFRAPTFNDLYWPREDWDALYGPGSGGVEGNPNLKPETATSYELGVGTFHFGKVETDITYFYNRFKDMINWTMDNTFWWRPTNVDTAVIKGVEANVNFEITKALKANLNYTRLSATNNVTHQWIIYRPRHEYKSSMTYDVTDRLNFYIAGKLLSKRYVTTDNSRFLKSYFIADTNISYKLAKFATLTMTVYNLFNRNYEEEEGYPMPGTSFILSTRLTF